jgi:hypothetical protein
MFNKLKLTKKDAMKFQFTVSVEDIENFVPPRKVTDKKKKDAVDISNYSYAVCIPIIIIIILLTNVHV